MLFESLKEHFFLVIMAPEEYVEEVIYIYERECLPDIQM